ncbi:MAG: transposase [Steroidobacteraceae bacterium]
MALGRREAVQAEMFVAAKDLPRSPGHVFYAKLNVLLAEADFDRRVEALCEPYYADDVGRPGIPPGLYFRMLFIGFFEGLGSQRAIAWRCADSLSVRDFLGVPVGTESPDHSSLTYIRRRLPFEVFLQGFQLVLDIARQKGLLKGKTLAVDSTMLEANAAMRSMVHRVSQKTWRQYLQRLAKAAGIEQPTHDDLRRMDRKRTGKKVSNADWQSPTDPDSRIARMKDGTTRFAYKAEHAVDVDSDLIVAAEIHHADDPDTATVLVTATAAREHLEAVESPHTGEELLGDRGYHKAETLDLIEHTLGMRPYIPEPKRAHHRVWTDKPPEHRVAVYRNRRRMRGARGRRMSRLRSEYAERSFAHVCVTGATRRLWLRGHENVAKWYLIRVAARNLAVIMRAVFNIGTPRGLQGLGARLRMLILRPCTLLWSVRLRMRRVHLLAPYVVAPGSTVGGSLRAAAITSSSTGC